MNQHWIKSAQMFVIGLRRRCPPCAAVAFVIALLPLLVPAQGGLLDLDGRSVDPLERSTALAQVFIFLRADCPISNRYAPEVERLASHFGAQGVEFFLVYPDPASSAAEIRRHLKEYGYTAAALRDPEHSFVRKTGASVTPEAAVYTRGRMVYRGRIDDRYLAFGRMRPAPEKRDLEEILSAIVSNRGSREASELRTTPAIGCYISDLKDAHPRR